MNTTTAMTTGTAGTTTTDSALLQLIWLASPALPVGGFSYSEGLEAAVDSGRVHDEASAGAWLVDQLGLSLARSDLPVVGEAVDAWRSSDLDRIDALNQWVVRTRETAELLAQAWQMGRSMLEWLKSVHPQAAARARSVPTYPIAFALAASDGTAGAREVMLAFAFGWAENMVQASIKSVPLGQSAGQRILAKLAAEIPKAVDHAQGLSDDTRQAFSPMLAILSAQHETQYSRLFRS